VSRPPLPSPAAARPAAAVAPLPVVLAHADGFSWDEALLVLAPIAIVAGVLLYVNRKLSGLTDEPAPDEDPAPGP